MEYRCSDHVWEAWRHDGQRFTVYLQSRLFSLVTYARRGNAEFAGVDNAGVDNAAPLWQGWTMQEWSEVTKAAYKTTSLANDSLYI